MLIKIIVNLKYCCIICTSENENSQDFLKTWFLLCNYRYVKFTSITFVSLLLLKIINNKIAYTKTRI